MTTTIIEDVMLIREGKETVLETVSEVAYTDTLDAPQHKTAAQYSVSDHIIQNPISVQLKLTILKDDLQTLIDLKDQKERLKFISETRVLDTVVITALNHTEALSVNTCNLTLKLQEIIVAKVQTSSEALDVLKAKSEGSVAASNSSSTPPKLPDISSDNITSNDIENIIYSGYTIEGMAG